MRSATPSPVYEGILTGHFHEGPGYATWRPHGTQDWLLIYTLDGEGRFSFPGGALDAAAGSVVLLQPETGHDYGTGGEFWEILWAHFHPLAHWHPWLGWPRAAPGLLNLTLEEPAVRQHVEEALRRAHRAAQGALARRESFAMNALEAALLWCDTQNPLSQPARLDPRIQKAVDRLCAPLPGPLSLNDLATECGLSVSWLSHLFREQVGVTPQRFLEQQRLRRARQLLELTSRPVAAIAYEVGYENPFYFTLRFRKETGLSPTAYRRKALAGG